MSDFVKKISDYGRSHPDFAPVLAKYGIRPPARRRQPPQLAACGSPERNS